MIVQIRDTDNMEGDYIPIGYWRIVKVHVSVICACLPALPSLFRKRPSSLPTKTPPLPHRSTQISSEVRCSHSNRSPSVEAASPRQRDKDSLSSRQIRVSSCITVTNTPRGHNEFAFDGIPSTYEEIFTRR